LVVKWLRTKNQEPRIKNQESRAKNQEPRTKNQTLSLYETGILSKQETIIRLKVHA
jgi:hypothetical protein